MGKSKDLLESLNEKLCMSRRSFVKSAAAFGGATALAGCSTSDDSSDLIAPLSAEYASDLREVRKVYSTCPVECLTHSLNCQLVGDQVVRVEPTQKPEDIYYTTACARGMSRMQFLTEDRVATPMKRIKKGTITSTLGVVLKDNSKDEWVSISWEQALNEIAMKMKELNAADGGKGMVLSNGSGNMGPIVNTVWGRFMGYVGPNRVNHGISTFCCQSVSDSMPHIIGGRGVDTRDTIRYSKCIINWGNNPAVSSSPYWKFLMDAKHAGAKIITIDPRYNDSAEKSHQWIKVKPGTDALVAIGMIRRILGGNLEDIDFLKHRTNAPYLVDISAIMDSGAIKAGAYKKLHELSLKKPEPGKKFQIWDGSAYQDALVNDGKMGTSATTQDPVLDYYSLSDKVATVYTLLRALYAWDLVYSANADLTNLYDSTYNDTYISNTTGVSVQALDDLTTAYTSTNKKSMIIQNMGGGQRVENGTNSIASQIFVAVLTGNLGEAGNGIDDTSGYSSYVGLQSGDIAKVATNIRWTATNPAGTTHGVPFGLIGRRVKAANNGAPEANPVMGGTLDPQVKLWIITTLGLTTQLPNSQDIKDALASTEMVVVAKSQWNTDADYCDYFLPVTTQFEYEDLGAGNRNKYLSIMEAGVKPYGQAMSDLWIIRELSRRIFGADNDFAKDFDHDDHWYVNEIITNPANNFAINGIADYDDLKAKKSMRPKSLGKFSVPFYKHEFNSGNSDNRASLFVHQWVGNTKIDHFSVNLAKDLFRGPFPRYVPAMESQLPALTDFPILTGNKYLSIREKFPLACVNFKTLMTVHSSFTLMPWIRELFGEVGSVWINTADALQRGINSGDKVTLESNVGKIERVAKVTEFIMEGVIGVENGWGDKYGKLSSSTLSAELPDPVGYGHTLNNTLVEVSKGGLK